jgi:hypothetical protein
VWMRGYGGEKERWAALHSFYRHGGHVVRGERNWGVQCNTCRQEKQREGGPQERRGTARATGNDPAAARAGGAARSEQGRHRGL